MSLRRFFVTVFFRDVVAYCVWFVCVRDVVRNWIAGKNTSETSTARFDRRRQTDWGEPLLLLLLLLLVHVPFHPKDLNAWRFQGFHHADTQRRTHGWLGCCVDSMVEYGENGTTIESTRERAKEKPKLGKSRHTDKAVMLSGGFTICRFSTFMHCEMNKRNGN